jgi:hypothetical protein
MFEANAESEDESTEESGKDQPLPEVVSRSNKEQLQISNRNDKKEIAPFF